MKQITHWNRRTFLSTASLTAAAAASPRILASRPTSEAYACVASANQMQLFHVRNNHWLPLMKPVACEAPSSITLHPAHDILYVAHSTDEYLNLPRASVSAWSIDHTAGQLKQINRVPLTLSATRPQHISISPNGRTLLISATGGGAYTAFSLATDGSIFPVPHALKQTGRGPHPLQSSAQPHAAIFHPASSNAYSCDLGSDRIDHLDFSADSPTVVSRISLTPGSGPQHIALHPSGSMLVTASGLQPALRLIAIDEKTQRIGSAQQHHPLDAFSGPICFSPSGDMLYATTSTDIQTTVSVFRVDSVSHQLRQTANKRLPNIGAPQQLLFHDHAIYLAGSNGIASLHPDTLEATNVLQQRDITALVVRTV